MITMTTTTPGSPYTLDFSYRAGRPLGLWLVVVVLLNVLLCTTGGHGGDTGFWIDWMGQLRAQGYKDLGANYPPLYVHWLWLITRLYAAWDLLITPSSLLRFLINTPIVAAHALLLVLMDYALRRAWTTPRIWNILIGFAALNPAILMNGPIWGQVDMVYCFMVVMALYLLIEGRYLGWVLPLLTAALLTKFQTICIAPLLLPLFWHRRGAALYLGSTPAILLAILLLLPYLIAGSTWRMFDETYLKASSMFPYATFEGNNLWYLMGLNQRPDSIFIFDYMKLPVSWQKFFTPKPFGIFLCGLWGLYVAVSSFRNDKSAVHWRNAILAALGFFIFLPGMHERYLMPAVVSALVAMARHPQFLLHAVVLSVLSALNMNFIVHPDGGLLPYLTSAITLLFALWAITQNFAARLPWARWSALLPLPLWGLMAVAIWGVAFYIHLTRLLPEPDGWIDATKVAGRTSTQQWGDLRIDMAIEGGVLSIGGQRFASGFGTHANATITIPVPPDAMQFSAMAGVDDAGVDAEVGFIVRVDDQEVWRSGPFRQGQAPRKVLLDVKGKKKIDLIADSLGSNFRDHADWVEPRFLRNP